MSKRKFKSNLAADKALRRISMDLIEQLNLFETSLHLHKISGLTLLEMEKLNNSHNTELERKQYLVTTVIPSKGHYKGLKLLRRALKESKQDEIVNMLDKAYEGEVDAVIAERLRLSQPPKVKHETGMSHHDSIQSTASGCDSITSAMFSGLDLAYRDGGGDVKKRKINKSTSLDTSSGSEDDDDDDDDDIVSLDSPVEQQQQQQPSYVDVKFQLPLSQGGRTTISVITPSPHRQRSNHISHQSNPFKVNATQPEQALVTVNIMSENSNTDNDKVTRIVAKCKVIMLTLQCVCVFCMCFIK